MSLEGVVYAARISEVHDVEIARFRTPAPGIDSPGLNINVWRFDHVQKCVEPMLSLWWGSELRAAARAGRRCGVAAADRFRDKPDT
jgi:hypothetical protein